MNRENLENLSQRQKRRYGAKNGQILKTHRFFVSQEKEKPFRERRAFRGVWGDFASPNPKTGGLSSFGTKPAKPTKQVFVFESRQPAPFVADLGRRGNKPRLGLLLALVFVLEVLTVLFKKITPPRFSASLRSISRNRCRVAIRCLPCRRFRGRGRPARAHS